jgi:AAA domain
MTMNSLNFDTYFQSEYANRLRNSSDRAKKHTLYHHQWKEDDSQCAVEVTASNGRCVALASANPTDLRLKFAIGGGTDCPFFQLTLDMKKLHTLAYLRFYAWAPASRSIVGSVGDQLGLARHCPESGKYSFSRRLYNVAVAPNVKLPSALGSREQLVNGWKSEMCTQFTWDSAEVIAFNLECDVSSASQEVRTAIQQLKEIAEFEGCSSFVAYLRGHKGIDAGWEAFRQQPIPTLPNWWRYAGVPAQGPVIQKSVNPLTHSYLGLHHWVRNKGWAESDMPGAFIVPHYVEPMGARNSFADEREYEIFTKGGLLREYDYQESVKRNDLNGLWLCNITPVSSIDPRADHDAFFIHAHVEPGSASTGPLTKVVEPPRPGTDVTVRIEFEGAAKEEIWKGRVVPAYSGSAVIDTTVYALRPPGGSGIILGDRPMKANFSFGLFAGPLVAQLKRVNWLMYGEPSRNIPKDSWLKRIVMGRGGKPGDFLPAHPLYVADAKTREAINDIARRADLNPSQIRALERSLQPEGGMSLVQGPPGTGKTKTIVAMVACTRTMDIPTLALAGSNAAADVLAQWIEMSLVEFNLPIEGVYRVERQSTEVYMGVKGLTAVNPEAGTSEAEIIDEHLNLSGSIRRNMEVFVDTSSNKLSLTKRILKGLEDYSSGNSGTIEAEEEKLLHNVLTSIYTPFELTGDVSGEELRRKRNKQMNSALLAIQIYYISRAKIIITTCASSSSPIMKKFVPRWCVVDEASQFTEIECLVPLVTYLPTVSSITLVGDHVQLKPTVASARVNEFANQSELSLFHRLAINKDIRGTMLSVQYRMHPSISKFPNQSFYGGKLQDHDSVKESEEGKRFQNWAKRFESCIFGRRSIFVNVEDGELLQEAQGFSKVNLANAGVADSIVRSMVKFGIPASDILVLSFYKAQVSLLRRLLSENETVRDVRVQTVDSAQGSESSIIVLDVVAAGGTVGFIKQPNRMNVALSRAKDGMVTIGNTSMVAHEPKTQGKKLWVDFIHAHTGLQTWKMSGYAAGVKKKLGRERTRRTYVKTEPRVPRSNAVPNPMASGALVAGVKRKMDTNDEEELAYRRARVASPGLEDGHITYQSEQIERRIANRVVELEGQEMEYEGPIFPVVEPRMEEPVPMWGGQEPRASTAVGDVDVDMDNMDMDEGEVQEPDRHLASEATLPIRVRLPNNGWQEKYTARPRAARAARDSGASSPTPNT